MPKEILRDIAKFGLTFEKLIDFLLESSLLHNLEKSRMMTEVGAVRQELLQEQVRFVH